MNIIQAMDGPFAKYFPHLKDGSWNAWRTFLRSFYGIPFTPDDYLMFRQSTGRTMPARGGSHEAFAICGRRSGKSSIASLFATYESKYGNWCEKLGPGQKAWIYVIATDKDQARHLFGMVKSFFSEFPEDIERENVNELFLVNGMRIAVKPAQFRSVRGPNLAGVVLDELAFFRSEESATPAEELLVALMPALIQPNARILGISSPYAKFGLLYDIYRNSYGDEMSDQLIWRAATRIMNPSFSTGFMDKLLHRDKKLFAPEFEAEFRDDISNFLDEATLMAYATGTESPPQPGIRYVAFVDPSSGKSDSMTLAIAHSSNGKIYLDLVREALPGFKPSDCVVDFSAVIKRYGVYEVISDRYASAWVEDSFRKEHLSVRISDLSASDIYLEAQARIKSGQCVLLNHEKLLLQLRQLEVRPTPGGRDKVSHQQGGHDDVSNSACGALVFAVQNDVWDAATVEAHMPVKMSRRPEQKEAVRQETLKATLKDDLDEFFHEEGSCRFTRTRP